MQNYHCTVAGAELDRSAAGHERSHQKSGKQSFPNTTQNWFLLGKLVATYNFAASLLCTPQSWFRTFFDHGSWRLSQSCDSCAAVFAVKTWAQTGTNSTGSMIKRIPRFNEMHNLHNDGLRWRKGKARWSELTREKAMHCDGSWFIPCLVNAIMRETSDLHGGASWCIVLRYRTRLIEPINVSLTVQLQQSHPCDWQDQCGSKAEQNYRCMMAGIEL